MEHNNLNAEKKTLTVIILTLVTMAAEIFVGHFAHSMALFADGWHMGTHALALSITFFTYVLIKKFSATSDFVFGTGKFGTLSGFASSILLGMTGVFIIGESIEKLINPISINFNDAILVAIIGLFVNSLCIFIMHNNNQNHYSCNCKHHEVNEDFNFKAAYMHIMADTMTSIFAIIALFVAKYLGWYFLDPIVGMIGGLIICIWAYGLIKTTSMVLLDAENKHLKTEITEKLKDTVSLEELHVWQTSENKYSLIGKGKSSIGIDAIKPKICNIAEFDIINLEIIRTSKHQ